MAMKGVKLYAQAREALAAGDAASAVSLFQRASTAGHIRSLCWMARLYARGTGVQQSCRMAELLLQQAAAQHDPAARRLLRYMNWKRLVAGKVKGGGR
jgi:TPR repeat protein